MRKKTETTKSILQQEASQLFDHGIQVFLSGPTDRIGICMKSEFEPITDRESLIHMCSQYPDANLEIVLETSRIFKHLKTLIAQLKPLLDTMTCFRRPTST